MEKGFDIDKALSEEITNVICIELNKPDIDLFAEAFYDLYIR
jgi:hypothetical protein